MKKINDFTPYTNILPYASEIFGVYQPMIGWKSKRMKGRMEKGFSADLSKSFESLYSRFKGRFEIALDERLSVERIERLEPARLDTDQTRTPDSFVIESIARELPPLEEYNDAVWDRALQPNRLQQTLTQEVIPQTMKWHQSALRQANRGGGADAQMQVAQQLNRESAVAGYLLYLKEKGQFGKLKDFFYKADTRLLRLQKLFEFRDPLEYIDPFKDIDRAGLSPIGIVHLFRQYFFEFDTFLGSPVGHVWLSPGASVELVEISTRKTVVERSFESTMETNIKTEKSSTDEDEISDAVKQDNKSDTKFGVNATANQSWIGGSATASSSIDIGSTQQKAREVSHKRMRSQTEKLSTEIRRNYKTTFKTVTETTDTSSKRYILANTTDKLINYEMRRKMRQVGVQVQDIGTYLCWQTYVDDPGRQLGIAKLVHLAKGPEVGTVPPPETVPMPGDLVTEHPIDIPFVPRTEDTIPEDDMDEAYRDGVEVNLDFSEGESEKIQSNFDGFYALCDQPNYQYADDIQFDYGGNGLVLKPQLDPMVVNNYRFNVAGKLTLKSPPANTPIEARRRLYYMGVNELAKQLTGDENGEVDKTTYDPWSGAKEFSMSVEDLYEKIRASTAGTIKEVHFFGHAWLGGPIIVNTMAYPDKRYDKDGRVKDFTTDKLNHVFDPQNRPHFQAAFASGAFTTVWGCENNKPARDLITAAKGKEKAGENFDAELRQLRQFLADTYANQLAKASGKTVYGPLPGTYSVHEGEPNDDASGIAFTPTAMHVNLEKCGHLLEFYKKHLGITFPTTGVFKGHATFGRGYAVYSP